MKIKRFEQINESSGAIRSYIEGFDGNCDDGIIGWIQHVAKDTNLKEYTNVYNKKFQEKKNLKAYNKFIDLETKLNDAQKLVDKLERSKEKLEINAKNELMYKFQEDLIENDPSSFYTLFMDGWDDSSNGYTTPDGIFHPDENDGYGESHPNIIKNYKEKLDLLISAKKYNL